MRIKELLKKLNIDYRGEDFEVEGISTLQEASQKEISFLENPKYLKFLPKTKAKAVFIKKEFAKYLPKDSYPIVCENPYLSMAYASKFFAKKIIDYLNATEQFQAIFGADNSDSKPNPDMLLKSMEICSCPNSKTVMVGDSIKDMLASNSAECRGLFASWGYGRESLSHPIIETPKDILRFLINNI